MTGTSANSIEYFLVFPAFGESFCTLSACTFVRAAGGLATSSHPTWRITDYVGEHLDDESKISPLSSPLGTLPGP